MALDLKRMTQLQRMSVSRLNKNYPAWVRLSEGRSEALFRRGFVHQEPSDRQTVILTDEARQWCIDQGWN